MLKRGVWRIAKSTAAVAAEATREIGEASSIPHPRDSQPPPLLPYAIRRATAYEMLYGGVRVQHLVQPPFPVRRIRSEDLPSPSLNAERHDLQIEMQLPRDLNVYNNINQAIQRQVGLDLDAPDSQQQQQEEGDAFDMRTFFAEQHHSERHHNSSLPYSQHDTNNVLAMRLFPVNVGLRARTEAIRIRTEDCLHRLRDAERCAKVYTPFVYPLSLSSRNRYAVMLASQKEGRHYVDASAATSAKDDASMAGNPARTAHLRGATAHPPSSELSILTRPVDRTDTHRQGEWEGFPVHPYAMEASGIVRMGRGSASGGEAAAASRRWLPLQMLKPMGHNWSAATRSSGVRGPHMQLMQERLDQKGFGWKRKSRSLWQQDVATAGFRPHRYF